MAPDEISDAAGVDDTMRRLARTLRSDRPLVALDVETTGTAVQDDRIVQVGWLRVEPAEPYEVRSRVILINPERPIPAEATALHGITDAAVAAEQPFRTIAAELGRELAGVDFIGYNFSFDRTILEQEFVRAGVASPFEQPRIIDPLRIWQRREPRDLPSAVRRFCGARPAITHRALIDAQHTARVLLAQLEEYEHLETTVESLHDFCHPRHRDWLDESGKIVWRDGAARLNFGRHRGVRLADVDASYLDWMLDPQREFGEDVRRIIEQARRGQYPSRPGD